MMILMIRIMIIIISGSHLYTWTLPSFLYQHRHDPNQQYDGRKRAKHSQKLHNTYGDVRKR